MQLHRQEQINNYLLQSSRHPGLFATTPSAHVPAYLGYDRKTRPAEMVVFLLVLVRMRNQHFNMLEILEVIKYPMYLKR